MKKEGKTKRKTINNLTIDNLEYNPQFEKQQKKALKVDNMAKKTQQIKKKNTTKPKVNKNKKKVKDNTTSVLLGLSIVSCVMVMAVIGQFYILENGENT